jgi:putative transcriptional regulator
MLEFKIDIFEELKKKGYSSYRIQKEKIIPMATYQNIKAGQVPGPKTLDTLCRLLKLQPGSIIRWVPDPEEGEDE